MRFPSFLATAAFVTCSLCTVSAQGGGPVYAAVTHLPATRPPAVEPAPVVFFAAPQLVGAQPDLGRYIAARLTYPELAREYAVEGEVLISYQVRADGRLTDVTVQRGLGFGCDAAVLDIFRELPRWTPGIRMGQPVAMQCTTPVVFRLQ